MDGGLQRRLAASAGRRAGIVILDTETGDVLRRRCRRRLPARRTGTK
jgi:hypothetical protein